MICTTVIANEFVVRETLKKLFVLAGTSGLCFELPCMGGDVEAWRPGRLSTSGIQGETQCRREAKKQVGGKALMGSNVLARVSNSKWPFVLRWPTTAVAHIHVLLRTHAGLLRVNLSFPIFWDTVIIERLLDG